MTDGVQALWLRVALEAAKLDLEEAQAQARSSRRWAWFWFICFAAAMSGELK